MKLFWNPTDQLRVNFRLNQQKNTRPDNGGVVSSATVPRLKVEYQLSKSLFLRFVGQYNSSFRDSLNDSSRDGLPIYFKTPMAHLMGSKQESNNLQADFFHICQCGNADFCRLRFIA